MILYLPHQSLYSALKNWPRGFSGYKQLDWRAEGTNHITRLPRHSILDHDIHTHTLEVFKPRFGCLYT